MQRKLIISWQKTMLSPLNLNYIKSDTEVILQLDYCLTTILKNSEKPRRRCGATSPGFLMFSVLIYAESLKQLGRKGSAFDRLITPTFQALPVETSGNLLQPLAYSQCRGKIPLLLTTI